MFEITLNPIGRFDAYRLTDQSTGEYLEVLADVGVGLNDLMVKNGSGELVSMIAGYSSDQEIRNTMHSGFKGSKLSPFPNRLYHGKYEFEGSVFQMFINEVEGNNNLHGLLHNKPFELVSKKSDDKSAELVLSHEYLGTEVGYPFSYKILVSYKMTSGNLKIKTTLENTDTINLPLGDGWHPYFKYDNVDNVNLRMENAARVSSLAGNSLSQRHGFENKNLINESKLDDCFEIEDRNKFNVFLEDQTSKTKIGIWQDSGVGQYRYLQVYTPDDRKSIAIEPVTCPPNAFNTRKDLIVLAPKGKTDFSIGISFNAL
ncbi:MAG: aldose 1-epimerase [Reichenbachiella sp.]